MKEIRSKAKDIIEKYQNKISGVFGEFISKCKSSLTLNSSGLGTNTTGKGNNSWNQQMNSYINSYVKKRVFQKKREYQSTYSRVKRGSGFVEYGQPINPGRKIKDNKLDIKTAFYVDRSGSMSGCIDDVWNAVYRISEALVKQFKKEKVVEDVSFQMHAFDYQMHKLAYGKRMSADGGTMDFENIVEYINENTGDFLINVIITDAQFNINSSKFEKEIKNYNGLMLFITNCENVEVKNLSKKYEQTLKYILASANFELG